MGENTHIEWADDTINFWWGCTRWSPGCLNCYAATMAKRFYGMEYVAAAPRRKIASAAETARRLDRKAAKAGKPRRVFVNSMSDVFDAEVPVEWRETAFAVMAECEHLIFLVLTKRTALMRDWFLTHPCPSNVWPGTSVENQQYADERLPLLLEIDAPGRMWASYEPALGPVSFEIVPCRACNHPGNVLAWPCPYCKMRRFEWPAWIIVGGESGPGARPFDLAWARSTVAQGLAADVPVFVKQVGALPLFCVDDLSDEQYRRLDAAEDNPFPNGVPPDDRAFHYRLRDSKGGDPAEWPEDLRVRQIPEAP